VTDVKVKGPTPLSLLRTQVCVPDRMLKLVSLRPSRLLSSSRPITRVALPRLSLPSLLPSRAMSAHQGESSVRPEPDKVLQEIADYVHKYEITSELAYETARLCLIDTIGCGLEGLRFPECASLLGPVVEGTIVPNGICACPMWRRPC
jgi:MmgE/PrpD N-terminal domain